MKLFLATDTVYTSNGERTLHPIKCVETKVMNEDWFIEVELPLTDVSDILQDSIVTVLTKYGEQPFRVNNLEVGNRIKFKARHIGYDLENAVINATSTDLSCQDALAFILSHCEPVSTFTAYSDIATHKTIAYQDLTALDATDKLRTENAGYLDFDKRQVRITSSLGEDRQVTIAYAKNLESASFNSDWSMVCTKIKPVGRNGLLIPTVYLTSDVSYDKPYTKIVPLDTVDVVELGTMAQAYMDENKYPKVNYKVVASIDNTNESDSNLLSFDGDTIVTKYGSDSLLISLGKTSVLLGDTIQVIARQFNVLTTVLAYTFNNITQRLLSVEFGNYRPTTRVVFSNAIAKVGTEAVRKASIMVDEVNGIVTVIAESFDILAGNYNAGKLTGAKYTFDGSMARFYGDGQEWYDNSNPPVKMVYFDTVLGNYVFKGSIDTSLDMTIGQSLNMPIYTPTDSTDQINILYNGAKGLRYGLATNKNAFITCVDMQRIISGTEGVVANEQIRMRMQSNNQLELYSAGTVLVGGGTIKLMYAGNYYTLSVDANGFAKLT